MTKEIKNYYYTFKSKLSPVILNLYQNLFHLTPVILNLFQNPKTITFKQLRNTRDAELNSA